MEPMPPMMTASKAKMRRNGPWLGSNVVRIASRMPASATMARAMAMARP